MVDRPTFEVGRNIAVTPGEVVLRTEVLELIQYCPQTGQVREIPLPVMAGFIVGSLPVDQLPHQLNYMISFVINHQL